ncbi:PVC-type heme-binding CxxCH protein [Fibrella aquatilis]|uniref:C-type cytochrome n=1 Tax=Fibrella aquatilis TaxID=2817059 RepID=A0A939G2W1_9BACT|nr:PVC-type heme-binding CxxCH protein [Fibrella aquatilis]MBO0930080.1 c-type cytochrome [Fibrella aquatilis]
MIQLRTKRTIRQTTAAVLTAGVLTGGLFMGAYLNRDLSRASAPFLNGFFATLSDDDKHDPKNAVASLQVAPDLHATLFAAEPMLKNPTNIDVDARGRVWVCEAYNYRPAINGNPTHTEGDRVVILEDQNGDGTADVSKVFYQGPELQSPLGIWVQGNKAIVSDSPNVWVFTDTDGDDKADKKEILFTGLSGDQHDHGMHAFVFGPDGKWYFNFGNEGRQIQDKNGKPIFDRNTGKAIDKNSYRQGMVFRCNPDGSEMEVLGQNFRNNFEVAIDSYGTLWQSDNDDDGNKGVRINYVMEYGNYGYTDEMTGAGWSANRTNLEKTIPQRHWHLNDPGVVPNLLQTGAGSPTGIIVYEGSLLPARYQNQIIHCDAGPNVVRSYAVEKAGAGYTASINNLVEGVRDQWFRPSDVCVAPDGSLLVADWYDPGVGGHQAGDQDRGRIFRLAPQNAAWSVPKTDVSTIDGAISALQSPNMSVRYIGWTALHNLGDKAEKPLAKFYKSATSPRMKARALWLLSQLPGKGKKYTDMALTDANPDIRITALRTIRETKGDVIGAVKQLVNDKDPQVRRECAIALRRNTAAEAPGLWAQLAAQHDGKDRWYLEALGIGADNQWDSYYAAYLKQVNNDPLANAGGRDVVWRARTAASVPLLAKLAGETTVPLDDRLRYFRAFDFNPGGVEKSNALLQLIGQQHNEAITKLALRHLDPAFVKSSSGATQALQQLLDQTYGTPEYVELVQRYEPTTENVRLRQLAILKPSDNIGREAARLLMQQKGTDLVMETINGRSGGPANADAAMNMIMALRRVGSVASLGILKTVALDEKRPMVLRREATRSLGGSMDGEDMVLDLLKTGQLKGELKAAAYQGVASAWRKSVKTEAAKYLDGAQTTSAKKLPSVTELLAMNGDATRGQLVYKNNCSVCHQINGEGMDFGPKLSEIGSKLGKDGEYLAILYPDAGISFGYEGYEVKFKDGSTVTGIISSKTETDLQMKFPGGLVQNYKTANVVSTKQIDSSMMPAGLQEAMTTPELVDLVEYLSTLKKK